MFVWGSITGMITFFGGSLALPLFLPLVWKMEMKAAPKGRYGFSSPSEFLEAFLLRFEFFSLDRAYVFKSELLEAITHEMKRMELGIWKTLNSHSIRIEPPIFKNLYSMYI